MHTRSASTVTAQSHGCAGEIILHRIPHRNTVGAEPPRASRASFPTALRRASSAHASTTSSWRRRRASAAPMRCDVRCGVGDNLSQTLQEVRARHHDRLLAAREMGPRDRQQARRAPVVPARRRHRARRRLWRSCPCKEETVLYHPMGTLATCRRRPMRGAAGQGSIAPAQARAPCVCPPTHTALVGAPPTSRHRLPAHWA